PEGTLSSPGIANRTGYCGYRFAPETEMYLARNRWLSPPFGRWIERDPLGYVDGMNLYEFLRCQIFKRQDAAGTETIEVEFNAFIPGRLGVWLPEPFLVGQWMLSGSVFQFRTDARDFGGGSSRLKTVATIDSRDIGDPAACCARRGGLHAVSTSVGASHRLSLKPSNDPMAMLRSMTVKSQTAIPTTRSDTRTDGHCWTKICAAAEAAYPFEPMSPSIDYSICWTFTVAERDRVTVTLEGEHNQFPNYEGLVHSPLHYQQYMFDTAGTGPGFWNLSLWHSFAGLGISFEAETSPCCP
ncbi:MAG TPA: hypothetical protein DCR65_11145, partial [Gammaproteobacteria bacterium]|nr:hypothetical protein [Gammaproteobacteria bacterium]